MTPRLSLLWHRRDRVAELEGDIGVLMSRLDTCERALTAVFEAADMPDPFSRRRGHLRVIDGGRAQGSSSAVAEAAESAVTRAVLRAVPGAVVG